MGRVLLMALSIVAGLLLVGQFLAPVHPLSGATELARPTASPSPSPAAHFASEGFAIDRDRTGQFHLDVAVNGRPTRFLVDTGADTLALTMADAEAAGIEVNPNSFQPILRTASGEGWGTLVTLDRIEIGNTELTNVGAIVVKDLDVSLLGQSILAQMGRVELQGDRMVIEPR